MGALILLDQLAAGTVSKAEIIAVAKLSTACACETCVSWDCACACHQDDT